MKKLVVFLFSVVISFLLGATLASNGVISFKMDNAISEMAYKAKIQKQYTDLLEELKEELDDAQSGISDELQIRRLKVSLVKIEKKVNRLDELHPYRWKDHLKNIDSEASEFRKRLKEQI